MRCLILPYLFNNTYISNHCNKARTKERLQVEEEKKLPLFGDGMFVYKENTKESTPNTS
jgi:hypothetical protein